MPRLAPFATIALLALLAALPASAATHLHPTPSRGSGSSHLRLLSAAVSLRTSHLQLASRRAIILTHSFHTGPVPVRFNDPARIDARAILRTPTNTPDDSSPEIGFWSTLLRRIGQQ